MTWSAVIQWGGRLVRVSGVDVAIQQRIDLASRETSFTPQRIELVALLPFDAAAEMYDGTLPPQGAAVAIVDEADDVIQVYSVIQITPGRAGEGTRLRLGAAIDRDASQVPSTEAAIGVRRVNVERTIKKRTNIENKIQAIQDQIDTYLASWGRLGNRYGAIGDRAEASYLEELRASQDYQIGRLTWLYYDSVTEGRTYQIVFGAPGLCDPTIRAIRASMVNSVDGLVMVMGHTATAGTCTLFGPDAPETLVVNVPTGTQTIVIPAREELHDKSVTLTTFQDQAGRTVTGIDVDAHAEFATGIDRVDREWYANFSLSQTARGLPSGVGDVLTFLLSHVVGVPVEYKRIDDLTARLSTWRLDGVIDQVSSAWDLLTSSILPLLPIHLVETADGLRPVYTSTIRGWRDAQCKITEGALFAGLGEPTLSADGGIVNDITVAYAYDCEAKAYRRSVRLGARDADHLADSVARYGYRPLRIETAWIYDDTTAAAVAREIGHRLCSQLLSLEYLANPAAYGPGGDQALEIGDVVRLTDARYSIADRLAMVTAVSRSPATLSIGLTLIPSSVPDYIVPPAAAAAVVYVLAVGDNGSSKSAARTSTNTGVTWAAVSGLPVEGTLNACVYDADATRYLCVGQAGAAALVTRDGGTVTNTSPGGTANLYGCTYRGASETGGALYVLVGNAGRLDHSADGATWTTVTGFGSTALYLAFYHDGYIYAGGNSGKMWYSSSGTGSYTACDPSGSQRNTDMCWTGTNLVVCRRSGKIAYATPSNARGGSWSAATSGVSSHLYAIASDRAGVVVAVGASGAVIRSTDHGATWSTGSSGVSTHLQGIVYTGSAFVVVGDSAVCLTSTDGSSWTSQTSGAPDDLNWVESSAGYP